MLPLNTTTEILPLLEARRRLDGGVRDRVRAMIQQTREIVAKRREIESSSADRDEDDLLPLAYELDRMQDALRAIILQLNQQGALVKDAERGLIDFYGWRGSEMVFLCWIAGEPTISYWHGLEAGFAGRRPIDGDDLIV